MQKVKGQGDQWALCAFTGNDRYHDHHYPKPNEHANKPCFSVEITATEEAGQPREPLVSRLRTTHCPALMRTAQRHRVRQVLRPCICTMRLSIICTVYSSSFPGTFSPLLFGQDINLPVSTVFQEETKNIKKYNSFSQSHNLTSMLSTVNVSFKS